MRKKRRQGFLSPFRVKGFVMAFDPTEIDEDHLVDGHLNDTPIHRVLMAVQANQTTGRLTIPTPHGENHMFFMRGQPVGVTLSEIRHPLGQMLLELGHINGAQFVRAQRMVAEAGRLPGQVYKELKAIDEDTLKEVFHLQARKKLEYFCRFRDQSFNFGRGLTFLSGFHSAPLHMDAVVFVALREYTSDEDLEKWLSEHAAKAVHTNADADTVLPAPLDTYGFGAAEKRFLTRLASGFEAVEHLAETGTLPRLEMAILLLYLDLLGKLQIREADSASLLDALGSSTDEDVFTSSRSQREREAQARVEADETEKKPAQQAQPPAPPEPTAAPEKQAPAAPKIPPARAPAPAGKRPPVASPANGAAKHVAGVQKPKRKGRREVAEPSHGSSATSIPRAEKQFGDALPSILLSAELQADVIKS